VLLDHVTGDFAARVFRRRIDHCFVITSSKSGFNSHDAALIELTAAIRPGDLPESIPSGIKKRPRLLDTGKRKLGKNFKLLIGTPPRMRSTNKKRAEKLSTYDLILCEVVYRRPASVARQKLPNEIFARLIACQEAIRPLGQQP